MMQSPSRRLAAAGAAALFGLAAACSAGLESAFAQAPPVQAPRGQGAAGPLSAAESLERLRVAPGLRVELVAAEPEVIDPVALAFDEDGRLFVAEMRDYPFGPAAGERPQSCIRLLEDIDGDGRYETSGVYAEGLPFCNGVLPWRGGVIATLAGEIAYFADDDRNGRADRRESWFTGFKAENSQLRANHPTLALDNHVYVANGLRGGDIIAAHEPWRNDAQPLSISGLDFRFDPRRGSYDAVTGHGQFGLTFDDFGNRFVCTNRNPCIQVMLENQYIKRNPHLALPRVVHDVSPAAQASHLHPLSRAWTTSNLHASQFTAACGVMIYRGDALPEEFRGNSFTCDPTGNLVHRDVLTAHGTMFDALPDASQTEFLATTDEWFRPVNLAHGPDGALYVAVMYRPVIEHPDFMPNELKQRPENFRSSERGRIYRITAKDRLSRIGRTPRLSKRPLDQLIPLLEHPGAWWRETAARLLLERDDRAAAVPLRSLLATSRSATARVQALWLLRGLDALRPADVRTGLADPDARVQAQAARLAEPWLATEADLRTRVVKLAEADDARLRFQVALSLGEIPASQAGGEGADEVTAALAAIALRDSEDPWTRAAVGTSLDGRATATLRIVLRRASVTLSPVRPGLVELVAELSRMVGSLQSAVAIGAVMDGVVPLLDVDIRAADLPGRLDLTLACVRGLGLGAGRRGQSLSTFKAQLSAAERRVLDKAFVRAVALANDSGADVQRRCQAAQALGYDLFATAGSVLLKLAGNKTDPAVRAAAIETVARFEDPAIGTALLHDFAAQTPALRRTIVAAMLASRDRSALLLDEMKAGRIAVTELQPDEWRRLAAHKDLRLRGLAKELQAASAPADRQQVIETYRQGLELAAEPGRGKEVFAKNCAACHRVAGVGVDVGPVISDSTGKNAEHYLVNILDPNRAVDNRYFSFTVALNDGRVLTGLIDAETASSVTVRQQDNKSTTILRDDIETIRSNGISLMPVGFERNISVQQMADLIAFMRNWRYLAEE